MKWMDIIVEAFNVPAGSLDDGSVLMDLEEWDSMAHMLFITRLEETYGIEFSGDEIAEMRSVGDIKKQLAAKGKEGE